MEEVFTYLSDTSRALSWVYKTKHRENPIYINYEVYKLEGCVYEYDYYKVFFHFSLGAHSHASAIPKTSQTSLHAVLPDIYFAAHEIRCVAVHHGDARTLCVFKANHATAKALARLLVPRNVHIRHPPKLFEMVL